LLALAPARGGVGRIRNLDRLRYRDGSFSWRHGDARPSTPTDLPIAPYFWPGFCPEYPGSAPFWKSTQGY